MHDSKPTMNTKITIEITEQAALLFGGYFLRSLHSNVEKVAYKP